MKKIITASLLLVSQFAFSQNLVPNPSFEDTVLCPDMTGQVARARYWFGIENTPDYFNECCAIAALGVPSNIMGYQYPHSGKAYVGLWDYTSSSFTEAIGTNLIHPLVVGQKYFVNLKVCIADTNYATTVATNKLGILFSTSTYNTSNPPPINNFANIYADSVISDSINWTTIRGSFIADSSYTFISIGNFFDHAHIDTIHLANRNYFNAYYYVDDVCVSTDSLYSELWTSIPEEVFEENIIVYPNPANLKIIINNIPQDCQEIDIYNIQGTLIKMISIKNGISLNINITSLKDGIYSLIFRLEKEILIKKFIKSNN